MDDNFKDSYFENILDHIKRYLPSFETIFDREDIYPIMFEFGNFLIDNYQNEDILNNCVSFINDALEKGGQQAEDVIVLQVFHLLYEKKGAYFQIEKLLSINAKKVYKHYYNLWTKDFS